MLPFDNLGGDPDQQYFADGLTEDILTALARFTQLMVIARNSTFVYRGRAVSIADVGRDLNVRYVLEGSVRRSGDRVRVTAQLIEAATSAHLWADRYDRTITDIFALQDEITERIVTTLVSNIERRIIEQARRKPPGSLGAYELFLQGREQRDTSRYEGMLAAEALFEQAVALDPGFALAHAEIAYIQYVYVTWRVHPERRDALLAKGFASARRALLSKRPCRWPTVCSVTCICALVSTRMPSCGRSARWCSIQARPRAMRGSPTSCPTSDDPPKRWSNSLMRGGLIRCTRPCGISILVVPCCMSASTRRLSLGSKGVRGGRLPFHWQRYMAAALAHLGQAR